MENCEGAPKGGSSLDLLLPLLGDWEGETGTWFDPKEPKIPGQTRTSFKTLLDGLFIQEAYTGTLGTRSHSGYRIFGYDSRKALFTCYWLDSFHTGGTAMNCAGSWKDGRLSVSGHYFGNDQEWGWQTELELVTPHELLITQYNISPAGQVDRAVESRLLKK